MSRSTKTSGIDLVQEAEEFLYIVSHDLKAFARAMRAIPDWIAEDIAAEGQALPPEAQSNFAMLQDYARRMDTTLDALTDLSRVGRISDAPAAHDLQTLVEEECAALPKLPRLECEIACEGLRVHGPENDFRHLFQAVLGNVSAHHDRMEGHLRVDAWRKGDRVHVSVSDDGPGIPAEQWEAVFKPLSALRPKSETGRAGMGLALARKVVRLAGGEIRVCAADNMPGSAVHFDLPAAAL